MNRRVLRILAVAAVAAASLAVPTVARAETCTDLPGSTTGATLEAGGQEIRIPAISGIQICTQGGGPIGGLPGVSTEPSGNCWSSCFSVILSGSPGGGDGYVALRFYADAEQRQVSVPIPGGGPSTERCLVGVGSPEARDDCEVKLSLDEVPLPICFREPPVCVPPEGGVVNEVLGAVEWVLAQWCIDPDHPTTICN